MKVAALFVLFVALSACQVEAIAVSALVSSLCPTIKEALAGEDFSTLSAALAAIADKDIPTPSGDVTIVAPTNEAFATLLATLKLAPEALLANTDLVTKVIAEHIIAGNKTLSGKAVKIASDLVTVTGANPVEISAVLKDCAASDKQTVLVSDAVIVLKALLAPAPAPAKGKAPAPGPAAGGTLAGLVDALCPSIKEALKGPDFTTLNAAIAALATAPINLPVGEDVFLIAPTNDAFAVAIKALGTTPAAVLADTKTLAAILVEHILTGASPETAKTITGNAATITEESIDVANTLAPVDIAGTVECEAEGQTAFVSSNVVVAKSLLAKTPAPAPAPVVVPKPVAPKPATPSPVAPAPKAPAPAPVVPSSASSAVVGFAAMAAIAMMV